MRLPRRSEGEAVADHGLDSPRFGLPMNAQRLSTADGTDEIAHAQMRTWYEAMESVNDLLQWDHFEHRKVTFTPLAGC